MTTNVSNHDHDYIVIFFLFNNENDDVQTSGNIYNVNDDDNLWSIITPYLAPLYTVNMKPKSPVMPHKNRGEAQNITTSLLS